VKSPIFTACAFHRVAQVLLLEQKRKSKRDVKIDFSTFHTNSYSPWFFLPATWTSPVGADAVSMYDLRARAGTPSTHTGKESS
jgi:hypothetical protein